MVEVLSLEALEALLAAPDCAEGIQLTIAEICGWLVL